MQIWLDTVELEFIKQAKEMGILFGVTTNPSLLAKVNQPAIEVIKQMLTIQPGPVAVQVTEQSAAGMLQQAKQLHDFNLRIIIKVPAIAEGFRAMQQMRKEKIPIMATAILEANQVLLSSIAGADYAAPYLGRIANDNFLEELKTMQQIIQQQHLTIKIIAAAIRDTKQVTLCAQLGVAAITLPAPVFTDLLHIHPIVQSSLEQFAQDWRNYSGAKEFFTIS